MFFSQEIKTDTIVEVVRANGDENDTYRRWLHPEATGKCSQKSVFSNKKKIDAIVDFARASHILSPVASRNDWWIFSYGVATTSRLLKIIGLFCRISSLE